MEDPASSASEVTSDFEAENSNPDSNDSDLYGDLESSLSQKWPQNVSGDSDVDDSDIFLELGMPVNHESQLNKINENNGKENVSVPETEVNEKQNVSVSIQSEGDAVAIETDSRMETHKECKDDMILQKTYKGKNYENMVAPAVVTSEQVGFGKKKNARSICGVRERHDPSASSNKNLQLLLSCLAYQKGLPVENSLEVDMNASMGKQSRDQTLNKAGPPSVSDTDTPTTLSESVEYSSRFRTSRQRQIKTENPGSTKGTVTDATDVVNVKSRLSSQSGHVGEEAVYSTRDKRICAADFMSDKSGKSFKSGPVNRTKRLRGKSEPKEKANSQMDLFEDFLVGRDRDELVQEVAKLKLEKETLEKQLDESHNRCTDLENDNEILLSNISALWKTAMSQLRKKCSELTLLKREKEAIIFRRAMRQVPKDELDLIISRIAAYNKDELCTFMKNLQEDEKECASSNVPSTSVEKLSLTQRIKLSIRGTRVQSSTDIEANTLQIMLGKQGERVTFSSEEVHKQKRKLFKDHADFKNQNVCQNYQKDFRQHTHVEGSRYSKRSDSMGCGRISQGGSPKNINNKDPNNDQQKFDTCKVEISERKSVFSRLGFKKPFVSPVDKVSVCDVRDVLKEKQNSKPSRPQETDDIHLHNSQGLGSKSTKYTPIYYREPKDNEGLKENSADIGGNDVKGKHIEYPLHKEEKSLKFTSVEVETNHIRKREVVDCDTHQKDSATVVKSPRPESHELDNDQLEIRELDTLDNEDEMLTKSLYGQRMIARLKNMSKPKAQPNLQPVVSCSLQSLALDSVSQPQDFDGERDCNMRTVLHPKKQNIDKEFDTVTKKNQVTKGSVKKVARESMSSDQKTNKFETNHLLESLDNEKLVCCPPYSGSDPKKYNSGQSVDIEGEIDGNLKTKMLPSTQKIVKENDAVRSKSQVSRGSVKKVVNDKSSGQREDEFEINHLPKSLSNEKLVSSPSTLDMEEGRMELVLFGDISERVGKVTDESTEAEKNNGMYVVTDANKIHPYVEKDFISKEVRERSMEMNEEKFKEITTKEMNDTFCSVSDNSDGTYLKKQDGKLSNTKSSYKESDIERKIAEILNIDGTNRIVRGKKESGISKVNKQSTKNLKTSNEVDIQESEPEGAMSGATPGRRSDRKLNIKKRSSSLKDEETLTEAESGKTSIIDERNRENSKTELKSNNIPDVDKSSSKLKNEEKVSGDSSLSKEAISVRTSKEIKSKEKKVKIDETEVEDRKDRKSDIGRNKQYEEGKVRDRNHKQGNRKSNEKGRKDDTSKGNEKSDCKSKPEGRQALKSKRKERINLKSTDEEIISVKPREEDGSESESEEEETDVKSKEEERNVKSEKQGSDIKPKWDRKTCARLKKGKHCVKLAKTEESHVNSRQHKRKKGERKDAKLKRKESKLGKPIDEERIDEISTQEELRVKSKEKNKDGMSEIQGDLTSKQEESKNKEQDRKPKEDERRDAKSKSKGKDGKSKDERPKENIEFVLGEEMQSREGKADEDGDKRLMQNETVDSEDCIDAQDSRTHVWDSDNLPLGNKILRGDSETSVKGSQELEGESEAPEEYSRNMNKQKCGETMLLRSSMSRKESKEETVEDERREEIVACTQSIEDEIKLKDCKTDGDHESDVIDIFCDRSDIENSSSEDESGEIYQGKAVCKSSGNNDALEDLPQLAHKEEERRDENIQEVEEHASETDCDHNESQCVFQVSEMQEKEYLDKINQRNHSENIQGQGDSPAGDYIAIHLNEEVTENDDLKEGKNMDETEGNGWMNHNEQVENEKDSIQNKKYIEESIFPEEEELLYDEGSDDSDENESSQDLHEPDTKSFSEVMKVPSAEGALFGGRDDTTKFDAPHSGKIHSHEKIDTNLKNDDLNSEKVSPKTLKDCRASEKLTKDEDKRRSVHDRLGYERKGENDGKRILSPVRTSPRKENKSDYCEKTLRNNQRSLYIGNEEENLTDEGATNNRNSPKSLTPKTNYIRSSESRSRSRSSSPRKECQSEIRGGRIRKLPQNLNCKHDQRSGESQSPLMDRENRLQEKKNALQGSPHKSDSSLRTRISRQQRKRTERPEESPFMMLAPPRTRETRYQTRKKEQQTESVMQGKQDGSSRSNEERIPLKRKERQEDWVESESKRRKVSVKSRLSRPAGSDAENDDYVEARRYPTSPPELERRRSSRLRNLSGERRHSGDSFCNLPERETCGREGRKALKGNDVVGQQHDIKETMGMKDGMKNSSAKNIRVDSKLLQSALAQSPKRYSVEEDEKEEGELDDDDVDEEVRISKTNKPKMGYTKNHTLNKEKELKLKQNAEDKFKSCQSETKWKHSTQQENETNQKSLREAKSHEHVILKEEWKFTKVSKMASKHRNDGSINEQNTASEVNLTHDIDEKTDNFSRHRECRMKDLTDSSEVTKNDHKHRSERRNLGSLLEDTTFFPADLFQVVPLQVDTNKINLSSVTGPSSGSDDTIDMIVKRHNEKYGSDNLNSSDDSEMSLLQFIADESDENSDNEEKERRKNNPDTQETTVRNVNENIFSVEDSTPRNVCDKEENVEIDTKTKKPKVIHRKSVDNIVKPQITSLREPRISSALLSNRTSTTFNVKEMDDTFAPAGGIESSNSRSTSLLNCDYSVAQDHQNSLEVSGNEGEIEHDKLSSFKSPNRHCGEVIMQKQVHKYNKHEKELGLNSHCSDTEINDKDGIENKDCSTYSINEGCGVDITLDENKTETDRYHLGGKNEHADGTDDDGTLTSPSTPKELLHPEQNTESIAASKGDDDSASSSSSDSDSDCECSKCASSNSNSSSSSSSSSSSGSDSDAENDVMDPPKGTNPHLETLQEQNTADAQSLLTFIEECVEPRSRLPSLSHDASPNKNSIESSVKVSQKKSFKSLHKTPTKSSHEDKKALCRSAKIPLKSPQNACKIPCKKSPHKTPCKKSPHKTPCKKSPHKTPCKKSPHKTVYRKTGKTPHKSPKSCFNETSSDTCQKAVLNIASDISGDAPLSLMVQDTTLKEKPSSVEVANTEIVPERNLLAHDNVNLEVRSSSPTGEFSEELKGIQNKSIDTEVIKSCDKPSEEQHKPASINNTPTSQTVIQYRKRRAANFGPTGPSQMKLSCVDVHNVISVVHSKEKDSKPVSSEKTLKKSTSRSPRKASHISSRASLVTPMKEKQAPPAKRQLSPISYEIEKETADGKKMRVLSPDMFRKVSYRLLFPDVGDGEKITNKGVGKSSGQSCASDSSVKSPAKLPASNSLVVPVRIRRAKRQLNLGLSGSSQNVVLVTSPGLSKNSKSSPQNNTGRYSATKTTPKTDSSKMQVKTILRRSPRKSPRKPLKYS